MSQDLLHLLKAQRRRRRLGFWLGFVGILLIGGVWAQFSKDPIAPGFANDFVVEAEEEIFFDEPDFAPVPTTVAIEPATTIPEEPTTTVEP